MLGATFGLTRALRAFWGVPRFSMTISTAPSGSPSFSAVPIALYHRQVLHLSQGKLADTERVQQTDLTRSLSQEIQFFETNLTQQLMSERQILALTGVASGSLLLIALITSGAYFGVTSSAFGGVLLSVFPKHTAL